MSSLQECRAADFRTAASSTRGPVGKWGGVGVEGCGGVASAQEGMNQDRRKQN